MNLVLAFAGVGDAAAAALRRAVRSAGVGVHSELTPPGSPATLLTLADSDSVIATATDASAAVVGLGSGVRSMGGGTAAGRALLSGARSAGLLSGVGADIVAVLADENGVTAASTTANQRLFHVRLGDGGIVVSSHLATLARGLGLEMDRGLEDFFLGYGFYPDLRTPFADAFVLAPGSRLEWTAAAVTVGTVVPPPSPASDVPESVDAAVLGLRDRFFGALEQQAGEERSHAVLLGGLDSALVASGLRRLGHDVHTFTFSFGDDDYEQRNVELVTQQLGTTHHRIRIDADQIFSDLENLPSILNQPGPQPHYQLHTVIASRAIRAAGFSHAFSGDGCDAVFLGYPTVSARARLISRLASVPPVMVRAGLSAMATPTVEDRLGHVARISRSTLGSLLLPMPARGHLPSRSLDEAALGRLRLDPVEQDESVVEIRTRLADGLDDLDPIRLAFHGNGLNGQSRVKVEGAVMATGVAHSSPFTDPALKSFALGLPVELLRPADGAARDLGKAVLIDMVRREGLLDDRIIDQPKQSPSDSPIDVWYMSTLRGGVLDLLESLPFRWDHEYVEQILTPKVAENQYRSRVSLSHHALSAVGLLASYAAFARTTQ